ncbi:MAG: hypothetical protein ACRDHY_19300 [Anaerolineales bacterium]
MAVIRLVKGSKDVLVDDETQVEQADRLRADGWKEPKAAAKPSVAPRAQEEEEKPSR